MPQTVWTRFAQKAVLDQAHVQTGEVFTVLTDDRVDPQIAEAAFAVGLCRTRNTQLAVIRASHFSEEPVHLNTAVAALLRESDVVLSVCETRIGQIPEVHSAVAAGHTRFLLAEPGKRPWFLVDGLINLDYEQMVKNVALFCKLWSEGSTSRITSASGTDLQFEIGDRPTFVSEGAVSRPGELEWFPGAMANVAAIESSIHGTVAVDGSLFPFGLATEVVYLELEHGVMTKIHGGQLAARFKNWLESLDDEVAYHLCHISVGFNPRAEITGEITEDERRLGAITIGFGRQSADLKGTVKGGSHHLDVILQPPTFVAGGNVLLADQAFNSKLGFVAL
jgi:2,5-dihydroxypyridine 5,6-dioxygenase